MRFTYLTLLGSFALPALCAPQARTSGQIAAGWYAGWHSTTGFPLSKVSWSKYTHLTYAFAETTADIGVLSLEGSNPGLLPQFVAEAKRNGVKALVSIGGWSGSKFWSANVASAEARSKFVETVTTFAKKYDLDGLDFDWEYPNGAGVGCNAMSPNDTPNFLAFLEELRGDPTGKKLILSAATAISPFNGATGSPSEDVSAFGEVLDFIAIMNYDIWGSWRATVGPNAPLIDSCAAPDRQMGSAVSAVKMWNGAGFPSSKIVLGVPAYGHTFTVRRGDAFSSGSSTTLSLYPPFDTANRSPGDSWDDDAGANACGVEEGTGGVITFWGLVRNGYLKPDGTPQDGIAYKYDSCSQTPYVYNPKTEVMVSYDNAQSFSAKGKFINVNGLKGYAMWESGGDYNNLLVDAIRESAGF